MENSAIFKPYQVYPFLRGDKQIMVKDSIGRQLPYIVNFHKSTCQVFNIKLERITHAFEFPPGCLLIDADYFPTKNNQFGIVVGAEDEQRTWGAQHFVISLTTDPDSAMMNVTNSLEVTAKITVVKTLFSNIDMSEGVRNGTLGLYHRLMTWGHIVAIGCKQTKCFLANIPAFSTGSADKFSINPQKKSTLDLMSSYVDDGKFTYTLEDGSYREYPSGAVYISTLSLMPRSRTLLVGFSMGGILSASLNPSNQMDFLELRQERRIHRIVPLEPEDDPDRYEYFIACVDRSPRHSVTLQLWRGSFRKEDVDDEEKYDRPNYNVCLEHRIPYGERWLAVTPIVSERSSFDITRKRNDSSMDSSTLNISQTFGSTLNRSNAMLVYERRQLNSDPTDNSNFVVEAAIFDMDAYYYKRTPSRVFSDGTVLRQCAFMSSIRSNIPSRNITDVGILTLHASQRFSSFISDADQLFYPSAVSYDKVFVCESTHTSHVHIQNIQDTILNACAQKLPLVVRSPASMANDIIAAGLVRQAFLTGSPNSSLTEASHSHLDIYLKVVLNAMIYYEKMEAICSLVARHDISEELKLHIAEWAMYEAVDYKRMISERTVSLFQGTTAALSPLAEETIDQGIKAFQVIHEYLEACSRSITDASKLQSMTQSIRCILNHTKLVKFFIGRQIIPVNDEVQFLMRQMHEKRKATSLKYKTALPIQLNVRNMYRLDETAQFWNGIPHDEWYPPTPIDLLESILSVSFSERIKREVIVQYILDWLRADPNHAEDNDQRLAIETIKVMTSQMLDVDSEKIYYILDQERSALKRTTSMSLSNDDRAKKVFTGENEWLTYEQLWSGEAHLVPTIKSSDLEKFEQRLKLQTETDIVKTLPVLDCDSEKLYQLFLFENQKYHLMSSEAIESNNLLKTFFSSKQKKELPYKQKSRKEKDIENSVKKMYEIQKQKTAADVPVVFATLVDRNGRKRRSEVVEENTSPAQFVPPNAKRTHQSEKESTDQNQKEPENPERNKQINEMIATPARYYKRPVTLSSMNVDMTSPTQNRPAPVPQQNSILKTAKAVQSPSRGRIRFHPSVRKDANQPIDSSESSDVTNENQSNALKKLDFAILEDTEEETIHVRKSSLRNSTTPDVEKVVTSVEKQEEFRVLEDPIEIKGGGRTEETFETHEDDVLPSSNETFDLSETEVLPRNEPNDEVQKDICVESVTVTANEEKEKVSGSDGKEEEVDNWDGVERSFEVQKDEDCDPIKTWQRDEVEVPQDEDDELAAEIPLNRTFEVQDEDNDPKPRADDPARSNSVAGELGDIQSEVAHEKINVLDDDDEDRPPSANTRLKKKTKSASRPTTPLENVEKEEETIESSKATNVKTKNLKNKDSSSRKTCADSVNKETTSNPTDISDINKSTTGLKSSAKRASSVPRKLTTTQRTSESETPMIGRVTRSRANSRCHTPARMDDVEPQLTGGSTVLNLESTPPDETMTFPDISGSSLSRRFSARKTIRANSVLPSTSASSTAKNPKKVNLSAPSTPRRGRKPKDVSIPKPEEVPVSARCSIKRRPQATEQTEIEEPAKKSRGRPRSTVLEASQVLDEQPDKATDTPKPRGSRSRTNSSSSTTAPTTPKRGKKTALGDIEEEKEPSTPLRRSARRLQHP